MNNNDYPYHVKYEILQMARHFFRTNGFDVTTLYDIANALNLPEDAVCV
jgi:hypothetical protein